MSKIKKMLKAIVLTRLSYLKDMKTGTKKIGKFFVLLYAALWTALIIFSITEYEGTSHESINFYHSIQFGTTIAIFVEIFLRSCLLGKNLKERVLNLFSVMHVILMLSAISLLENVWMIFSNMPDWFVDTAPLKMFRLARVIPFLSIIPGIRILSQVIEKEKAPLKTIFFLVIVFILISSVVIYHIETSDNAIKIVGGKQNLKMKTFLDAIYFSTISVTTIGFGDITPITEPGKIFMIFISLFGVIVIALPTAVISGGFISHLGVIRREAEKRNETQMFRRKKGPQK